MRRILLGAAAGVALLGSVLALIESPPDASTRQAPPSAAMPAGRGSDGDVADAELRQQLRQLRNEVAALRSQGVQEGAAAQEEGGAGRPVAAAPPSRAEMQAAIEGTFDAQLDSEAEDPAWSRPIEARIEAVLDTQEFAGTKLRAARCQQSLCRVEVGHDDADAQERFVQQVKHTQPFATSGYIRTSLPGEPTATTIYVAREGLQLPHVAL
jgi:hypothetical protein